MHFTQCYSAEKKDTNKIKFKITTNSTITSLNTFEEKAQTPPSKHSVLHAISEKILKGNQLPPIKPITFSNKNLIKQENIKSSDIKRFIKEKSDSYYSEKAIANSVEKIREHHTEKNVKGSIKIAIPVYRNNNLVRQKKSPYIQNECYSKTSFSRTNDSGFIEGTLKLLKSSILRLAD